MRQTAVISPTIAANSNDWSPAGIDTCEVIRVNVSGTYNLTGIAGGSRGRVIDLYVTSGTLNIKSGSGLSAVGNTFDIGAHQQMIAGDGVTVFYDITSAAWRLRRIADTASAAVSGPSLGLIHRLNRYCVR